MIAGFHCDSVLYVVFKHFHLNLIDLFGEKQYLFSKYCFKLHKSHSQKHAISEKLAIIK